MAKRFQLQPLAQALALGLPAGVAAFTSMPVEAVNTLTLPTINTKLDTGGNISVTSPAIPLEPNSVISSAPSIVIPRFVPSLGVLTQVDSNLSTLNFNLQGTLTGQQKFPTAPLNTVRGRATFNYAPDSPFDSASGSGNALFLNCTVANKAGCSDSGNLTSIAPLVSQASSPSTLDAYTGETGTVTIFNPALTISATSDSAGNPATATASLKWLGTETISYSYLNHAAPSFSKTGLVTSLILDFGNLQLGSASGLKWLIDNPGNLNTVGLDFDSLSTSSSDAAKFNLGASLFSGFAAGGGKTFSASLDTSQSGSFLADYILHFSDADVGAPSTRFNYDLNLTLKGVVSAPVPLPGAWMLMASGLGLFGWKARKRLESG